MRRSSARAGWSVIPKCYVRHFRAVLEHLFLVVALAVATTATRALFQQRTSTGLSTLPRSKGEYFIDMADQPRRVNFFDGMLLTTADFADEQRYHREMRYLHNRLHGYGTVSGLEVTVTKGRIRVAPGTGIDVLGREIVVTTPLTMRVEPHRNGQPWVRDLVISWSETADGPVPRPDGAVEYTRWVEQPELTLVTGDEPAPEGLVLARLTRTSGDAVDVDTSVRRPLGRA